MFLYVVHLIFSVFFPLCFVYNFSSVVFCKVHLFGYKVGEHPGQRANLLQGNLTTIISLICMFLGCVFEGNPPSTVGTWKLHKNRQESIPRPSMCGATMLTYSTLHHQQFKLMALMARWRKSKNHSTETLIGVTQQKTNHSLIFKSQPAVILIILLVMS